MATIAEGWAGTGGGLLLGDERRKLQEAVQLLHNAYMEGPFVLPPEQLLSQLKEQGPDLLYDLVQQLQWETLGAAGYAQDLTAERTRAIDESRRLWKYNPLAQWMIWLWTNYGFGENIVITPEDEDAVGTWEEFWKADRNQSVLAQDKIADKLSNWLLVDGDRFLAFYASTLDGETTIRRINTKEIVEIVTDPEDFNVPLFYKRQWTAANHEQRTWYYPDWEAFFRGDLDKAKLPQNAIRADEQNEGTTVVILHISFNGKDEDSLFGWPLLAAGSPWIRSQKRHLENRLAVSAAKAMYVRQATVRGGSRAIDNVIANLRSALSSTQRVETNPPAVAGSTLVENQAVTTTDFPMTTGASDAKTDGEMFAWIALLSGGVFPHYAGMDAHLFTRQGMEKPLYMQWNRYKTFWSAQFRKIVRIVLQMAKKYGDVSYSTYDAEVSTDRLVEVDLGTMSESLSRVFNTMFNPQVEAGTMPDEVTKNILQVSWRVVLQALGVDAETVVGDEVWKEPEAEEAGLEESIAFALQNYRSGLIDADDLVAFIVPSRLEEGEGPGRGWWGPPKGTHVAGKKPDDIKGIKSSNARWHSWEEVEKSEGRLWTTGEGKSPSTEERKQVEDALDALKSAGGVMPTEIVHFTSEEGADVPFARNMGDGKVGVFSPFYTPAAEEFNQTLGGRAGILSHEMGHSLVDLFMDSERTEWQTIWQDAKRGEGDYLKRFPSYESQRGWIEDASDSYRVMLGLGKEKGHLGPMREKILKDAIKRYGK